MFTIKGAHVQPETPLFSVSGGQENPGRLKVPGRTPPFLMAHRGSRGGNLPENTLPAFLEALSAGADMLETDLRLSSDGEFMCIHDSTLDRTTDGKGPVKNMTAADLGKISAGKGFPGYDAVRIPTLSDLAKILPNDAALGIELKSPDFRDIATCRRLVALLRRHRIEDRTFFISFSHPSLRAAEKAAPAIPRGLISFFRPWPRLGMHLSGPFWPILFLNPLFVIAAHARRMLVCPLDPGPDSRLGYYLKLGCDAIMTDNPRQTIAALSRRGVSKSSRALGKPGGAPGS